MRPLGTLPFQASAIRRLRKPKHCARKSPRFRQWLTQPPARSARRNEAPRAAYSPAGRLLVMRIHVACGPQSADRVEQRFDLKPKRLIGDTAYGTAAMLGWMVDEKAIEPHVPVWDKT